MTNTHVVLGEKETTPISEEIIELACDADRWQRTQADPETIRKNCYVKPVK